MYAFFSYRHTFSTFFAIPFKLNLITCNRKTPHERVAQVGPLLAGGAVATHRTTYSPGKMTTNLDIGCNKTNRTITNKNVNTLNWLR